MFHAKEIARITTGNAEIDQNYCGSAGRWTIGNFSITTIYFCGPAAAQKAPLRAMSIVLRSLYLHLKYGRQDPWSRGICHY